MTANQRLIAALLLGWGCIDGIALAFAGLPRSWMASIHAALGLGTMPQEPITGYLARSTCLLYALYGVLLIGISLDVRRYWKLIRILAFAAVIHGLLVMANAFGEGMPFWWGPAEGTGIVLGGLMLLLFQSKGAFTLRVK